MATVIDALLIDLGLDSSAFLQKSEAARADMAKTADAGRKVASETEESFQRASEASVKHSKELEAWGKSAAESLGLLRDTALGLLAALGGADAVKMVIDTSQAEAATARLAHNLQLPDRVVSQWQMAMATVGGSAEDANASLEGMQAMIMNAKNGDMTASNTMGAVGISPNDDAATAMMKASAFAVTHTPAVDQKVFAGMGLTPAMFNFIDQGPAVVQSTLDRVAPYSMTQQEGDDAKALQNQWGILKATFTGIEQELEHQVNPALSALLTWLQRIADWMNSHPEITGKTLAAGAAISGAGGVAMLKKFSSWLLGRGGPGAAAQAAEASGAAEVAEAGGTVALSPALMAALGVYATNALGEPGIDPNEAAELRKLYPNAPQGTVSTVDTTLPPVAQDFLNKIRGGESGDDYSRMYGNLPDMTSFADHPGVETQLPDGTETSAAGGYQFEIDTWKRLKAEMGLNDFSPANQDKAAWQLAQEDYQKRTGRNLLVDLQAHDAATNAGIKQALAATWPSIVHDNLDAPQPQSDDSRQPFAPPAPRQDPTLATGGPAPGSPRPQLRPEPPKTPATLPPIVYEPALPQGVVDLMNQMRVPPPSPSAAAMIAHHRDMAAAAPHVRHIHNHHGPVNSHNTSTAETHVHSVNIQTKATNADGIARSLGEALKRNAQIANFNKGLL